MLKKYAGYNDVYKFMDYYDVLFRGLSNTFHEKLPENCANCQNQSLPGIKSELQ